MFIDSLGGFDSLEEMESIVWILLFSHEITKSLHMILNCNCCSQQSKEDDISGTYPIGNSYSRSIDSTQFLH